MKVFIAGDKGMVGSALKRTAKSNIEVMTVSRNSLDLSEASQVLTFLEKSEPEAIILAAARVGGIGANSSHQKDFLLTNLKIQNAVIEAAARLKIPKLLFLGSSCIYPRLAEQPITEDSLLTGPLEPTNEGYALAKIAGIRLCRAVFEEEGLKYFSLMPTNLYGPNDNFDYKKSHVPAALMRKFHEAKERKQSVVSIWGSGNPRREFLHVDDMAQACWFMLDKANGGELLNVGTGEDVTIKGFAQHMAECVGFKGELQFDHSKPDGTPRKLLNVDKIHTLGWKHKIELEQGLKMTYEWFQSALKRGEVRGY
jgi:GDP-L-fucose synthase